MKANRINELTEYFGRLGLAYSSDRRAWDRNGSDRLNGPYRGVTTHVSGERAADGHELTGMDYVNRNPTRRTLFRNYLQVSVETSPVRLPVGVIPRNEYALLDKHGFPVVNGQVIMARGEHVVGHDMLRSRYLALNRLLDSGVPEFDANFGVVCDDESYARTMLPPDLLRWIAGDQRSYGTRLLFRNDRLDAFVRTDRLPEPPELFAPEWIFPIADYLIELLGHPSR